jgi:curved DNA-binding protein CbpA
LAFHPHYYEVLGIDSKASQQAIEHVYKNLQRAYHPDLHTENKAFYTEKIKLINEAYEVLGNPEKRTEYDRLFDKRFGTDATSNTSRVDGIQDEQPNEYCPKCRRQLEGLVVTCPHCGAWISAGDSWKNPSFQENLRTFAQYDTIKGNGVKMVKTGVDAAVMGCDTFKKSGVKFAKNGASKIGVYISKILRSAPH